MACAASPLQGRLVIPAAQSVVAMSIAIRLVYLFLVVASARSLKLTYRVGQKSKLLILSERVDKTEKLGGM